MSDKPSHIIRFADLPTRKRTQVVIEPDADARRALADAIDALSIRKLRFEGTLLPKGKHDWRLEGHLGATVQQACVVTLDPVTTRIDEDIERSYLRDLDDPDADEVEVEVTDNDTIDPLPETLDLMDVIAEALTLALPAYPRKDGAEAQTVGVTEPGKSVMTDEDARPFAGLAALRDSLENKDTDTE